MLSLFCSVLVIFRRTFLYCLQPSISIRNLWCQNKGKKNMQAKHGQDHWWQSQYLNVSFSTKVNIWSNFADPLLKLIGDFLPLLKHCILIVSWSFKTSGGTASSTGASITVASRQARSTRNWGWGEGTLKSSSSCPKVQPVFFCKPFWQKRYPFCLLFIEKIGYPFHTLSLISLYY